MNKDKYWLLARAIYYQRAAVTHSEMQEFADRFWDAADLFAGSNDNDYNVIFGAVKECLERIKENLNYDE